MDFLNKLFWNIYSLRLLEKEDTDQNVWSHCTNHRCQRCNLYDYQASIDFIERHFSHHIRQLFVISQYECFVFNKNTFRPGSVWLCLVSENNYWVNSLKKLFKDLYVWMQTDLGMSCNGSSANSSPQPELSEAEARNLAWKPDLTESEICVTEAWLATSWGVIGCRQDQRWTSGLALWKGCRRLERLTECWANGRPRTLLSTVWSVVRPLKTQESVGWGPGFSLPFLWIQPAGSTGTIWQSRKSFSNVAAWGHILLSSCASWVVWEPSLLLCLYAM